MRSNFKALFVAILGVFALASTFTHATEIPGMKSSVKVSKEVLPGRVIYHYRFINESIYPVGIIFIGKDYLHGGDLELAEYPKGHVPRDEERIPPGTVVAPPGWKATLLLQEESDLYSMRFDVFPFETSNYLAPGKTASGFSIIVAKEDDTLLKSNYAFYTAGSSPLYGQFTVEPFSSATDTNGKPVQKSATNLAPPAKSKK